MNRLRSRFAVISVLFSLLAGNALVFLILQKRDVVADVANALPQEDAGEEIVRYALNGENGDIVLPLPDDVHREDIRFENHYLSQHVCVVLHTADSAFYDTTPVPCNTNRVTRASYAYDETASELTLTFATDRLYEPLPDASEGNLRIYLSHPADKYDKIVIVDPAYAGTDADAALHLALKVAALAAEKDDGMRVYVTRTSAGAPDPDLSAALERASGATRYLRLILPSGESARTASAVFYDAYYIRGYGNAAFAGDALASVAATGTFTATRVTSTTTDPALAPLKTVAAALEIDGIRGAAGESDILLNRLAEALYNCILESYD